MEGSAGCQVQLLRAREQILPVPTSARHDDHRARIDSLEFGVPTARRQYFDFYLALHHVEEFITIGVHFPWRWSAGLGPEDPHVAVAK